MVEAVEPAEEPGPRRTPLLDADAGLLDLSHRELLRVSGKDRHTWLQGLLTNEVEALAPGRGNYQALLNAKGRMVSDGWLLRREGELLLDVTEGRGGPARRHLDRFLISEQCELGDATDAWGHLALVGPGAAAVAEVSLGVKVPEGEGAFADAGDLLVQRRWLGVHLFFSAARGEELRERLTGAGVGKVGLEEVEPLRIEAGIARWGRELDEETIPLEAQLGAALSFTKGCYVGQEVIARGAFRGQMNRYLVRLRLRAPASPGVKTLYKDKPPGVLTSVAGVLALGYVRRECAEAGAAVELSNGGAAEVLGPPFGAERLPLQ